MKFNIYTQCEHCKKNAVCNIGDKIICKECVAHTRLEGVLSLESTQKCISKLSSRSNLNNEEKNLLNRYKDLVLLWGSYKNATSDEFAVRCWYRMHYISNAIYRGFVTAKCDYCKEIKTNIYSSDKRMCHECWVQKEFNR